MKDFDKIDIEIMFDLVDREISNLETCKNVSNYMEPKKATLPIRKDSQYEFDLRTLYRKLQILHNVRR